MSELLRYTMTVGTLLLFGIGNSASAHTSPGTSSAPILGAPSASAKPTGEVRISTEGTCHVVALFAKLRDEAPDETSPPSYARNLFDPDRVGSFTHFYNEMSLGKLTVVGETLPRYYTSDRPASEYNVSDEKQWYFGTFNREVLNNADHDVDFGLFDNDGPDGIPNSGDDDGYVDFLFINVKSTPTGFLRGSATGVAELGLEEDFITDDPAPSGRIKITSSRGTTQRVHSFEHAVGVMVHEFGHALGLPDLYDISHEGPEDDAAGIGRWGIMGRGALGWDPRKASGPVPFCAWSREQLGWANIVEITEDVKGRALTDVATAGTVYRIPLSDEGTYYLIENRQSTRSHYDRNIPQDGLLIWYIRPRTMNHKGVNADELDKMVDLVCADGLYGNRGYPHGQTSDRASGRDNLDFWAHDKYGDYRSDHNGNLGDATDVFDGFRFTAFTPDTNPCSRGGVRIENIWRNNTDMIANIEIPKWSGTITKDVTWDGVVNVVGDIVVQKNTRLTILSGTVVRFFPNDVRQSGTDTDRCEIDILGRLHIKRIGGRQDPVRFTGEGRATWAGIQVHDDEGAGYLKDPHIEVLVEDCDHPDRILRSGSLDAQRPNSNDTRGQMAYMQNAREIVTLVEDDGETGHLDALPSSFTLGQNFPNPFNAETTISFDLPRAADITLTIFNAAGQMVKQWQGYWSVGHHTLTWNGQSDDGNPVASGVYFYRLRTEHFTQTQKATLMR